MVYYNEQSSQSSGSGAAGSNATESSAGGFSGRVDQSGKAYNGKSSKVPHKPIEQLIIHNSDN